MIYEVYYLHSSDLLHIKNQQTGQVLKQGGATHNAIVASIADHVDPDPEPEPEPPVEG